MSYSKEELITILTPALVNTSASTPREVRGVLETYSTEQLTVELARQRRAGYLRAPQLPRQDSEKAQQEAEQRLEAIRAEAIHADGSSQASPNPHRPTDGGQNGGMKGL